jgi:hypothetical protein
VTQVVEYLLSKLEALSSNSYTVKKKKKLFYMADSLPLFLHSPFPAGPQVLLQAPEASAVQALNCHKDKFNVLQKSAVQLPPT